MRLPRVEDGVRRERPLDRADSISSTSSTVRRRVPRTRSTTRAPTLSESGAAAAAASPEPASSRSRRRVEERRRRDQREEDDKGGVDDEAHEERANAGHLSEELKDEALHKVLVEHLARPRTLEWHTSSITVRWPLESAESISSSGTRSPRRAPISTW